MNTGGENHLVLLAGEKEKEPFWNTQVPFILLNRGPNISVITTDINILNMATEG